MPDTVEPRPPQTDIDQPDVQAVLVAAHLDASVAQIAWAVKKLKGDMRIISDAIEKALLEMQAKLPAIKGWPAGVYISLFVADDGFSFAWAYPDVHAATDDLVDEMSKGHEGEFKYRKTVVVTEAGAAFVVDLGPLVEEARAERVAEAVEWRGRMQRTPPI